MKASAISVTSLHYSGPISVQHGTPDAKLVEDLHLYKGDGWLGGGGERNQTESSGLRVIAQAMKMGSQQDTRICDGRDSIAGPSISQPARVRLQPKPKNVQI